MTPGSRRSPAVGRVRPSVGAVQPGAVLHGERLQPAVVVGVSRIDTRGEQLVLGDLPAVDALGERLGRPDVLDLAPRNAVQQRADQLVLRIARDATPDVGPADLLAYEVRAGLPPSAALRFLGETEQAVVEAVRALTRLFTAPGAPVPPERPAVQRDRLDAEFLGCLDLREPGLQAVLVGDLVTPDPVVDTGVIHRSGHRWDVLAGGRRRGRSCGLHDLGDPDQEGAGRVVGGQPVPHRLGRRHHRSLLLRRGGHHLQALGADRGHVLGVRGAGRDAVRQGVVGRPPEDVALSVGQPLERLGVPDEHVRLGVGGDVARQHSRPHQRRQIRRARLRTTQAALVEQCLLVPRPQIQRCRAEGLEGRPGEFRQRRPDADAGEVRRLEQGLPEARRVPESLGEESETGHAQLLQPGQHLVDDRVADDGVECGVGGHQERRLQCLQCQDAEGVPRAGGDEAEL